MGLITVYRKLDGSPLHIQADMFDPDLMTREPPDDALDAPTDPEERLVAIRDAIGQLDRENPEHFTKDGKPQVAAIEAILGYEISAAERDAAWEALQAE